MFRWFLASLAIAGTVASASADFTVAPIVGPATTSPNFTAFAQNGALAMKNYGTGLSYAGDPNTPSVASPLAPGGGYAPGGAINFISTPPAPGVTSLWKGDANNNNPNLGPAFNNEVGNFTWFGMKVIGGSGGVPASFSLNSLGILPSGAFTGTYTPTDDPNNIASFIGTFNPNIYFTDDGMGGITQVLSNSQTLTSLYSIGRGMSIQNSPGDYGGPGAETNLENLMRPTPTGTPQGLLVGTYNFTGGSASAGLDINGVPAPATIALMGFGLAGIVARVRRKTA